MIVLVRFQVVWPVENDLTPDLSTASNSWFSKSLSFCRAELFHAHSLSVWDWDHKTSTKSRRTFLTPHWKVEFSGLDSINWNKNPPKITNDKLAKSRIRIFAHCWRLENFLLLSDDVFWLLGWGFWAAIKFAIVLKTVRQESESSCFRSQKHWEKKQKLLPSSVK